MSEDEFRFMNSRWPARLNKQQVCWFLNCELHDLPALMKEKLIVPLGKPADNGRKFFDPEAILASARDRKWLIRMSEVIRTNWQDRNGSVDGSGDQLKKLAA